MRKKDTAGQFKNALKKYFQPSSYGYQKDTAGQFKNALKKYQPSSYGYKKDTAGQFKNALKNIFNLVLMGIMSSHF